MEPENVLKGRMAESLVDELLRNSGNRVYRFGYEAVLQNLTQIDPNFDRKDRIGQQISSIPDFLVLSPLGKPFFVEVKFRSNPAPLHDDFVSLLKIIEKFWAAKVILVTPQQPYFRIANPPSYFDDEGRLVFRNLEDDPDLNVTCEGLRKFDSLVQKYFDQAARWNTLSK